MQRRLLFGLLFLAVGLSAFTMIPAAVAMAPDPPPAKVDEATVRAWEKRGFKLKWYGRLHRGGASFASQREWVTDPIPAFEREQNPENDTALKDLPVVAVPFALRLTRDGLSPEALNELAGLENLTALEFCGIGTGPFKAEESFKALKNFKSLRAFGLTNSTPERVITPQVMRHLLELPNLTDLNLLGTGTTDAALAELKSLKRLRSLDLSGCPITAAGLRELAGLKEMRYLNLGGTRVTDAGLVALKDLTKLEELTLSPVRLESDQITDAGMKVVGQLPNLVHLKLVGSAVTDAGVKELVGLHKLRTLHLPQPALTDNSLKMLLDAKLLHTLDSATTKEGRMGQRPAGPEDVDYLHFSGGGTKITDAGLEHLKVFKNLTRLSLNNMTGVTPIGVEKIRKLLPDCRVTTN